MISFLDSIKLVNIPSFRRYLIALIYCDRFPSMLRVMCSHCADTAPTTGARPALASYLVDQTDTSKLVYAPVTETRFTFVKLAPSTPMYRLPDMRQHLRNEFREYLLPAGYVKQRKASKDAVRVKPSRVYRSIS